MVPHEALANLVHDDAPVSTFDKAHIRIHKGKPETQIIVLDFIQTLFALFRTILRHRYLPLQNIQIDQRFQILGQAGGLDFQHTGNGRQFRIPCRNRLDD